MNHFLQFKHHFLLIILFAGFHFSSVAQTIRGKVADAKTGEILIGATVHIEKDNFKSNTTVKLDGIYTFKNIPAGAYKLSVSFVGYKTTKTYDVEANATGTTILNIAMLDNATVLNEVAITEHASKESDKSARSDEKNSNNTINVVSASSIAISPDVLVSNVLSRVSGITIDRNNTGDAEHVIIRGMDKQYNTVLINGVKIPSPDNKNRYVPLDIFPADLVEKIEVYKSLTPDMEGDASGGVVNMVMKTAPDRLKIEGDFGTGYSQLFLDRPFASFNSSTVNSKAPGESLPPYGAAAISDFPYQNLLTKTGNPPPNSNASLTIGNRYLNNKLGVLFSGTYQNSYQGSNSFVVVQENTVGASPNINTPNQETAFQSSYNRQYSSQLSRLGTIASIDYKFDPNNVINLFGTYLQLDDISLAYLNDPAQREQVSKMGEDGEHAHIRHIKTLNEALAAKPAGMSICTHLCRGNFRSSWAASGGYDHVAEALFGELNVDGYFLEFDDARSGTFAPLRFVPKGKKVVLGLLTSKRGDLENKDDLRRRIDEAAKYVALDQICLSPQCGFSSTSEGNALTMDQQFDKLRLVVETAREIWRD